MPAAKLFSLASEPHGGGAIARRSGTLRGWYRLVTTTTAVEWSGGVKTPWLLVPRLCRATLPSAGARLCPHALGVWDHLHTLAPRDVSSLLRPGGGSTKPIQAYNALISACEKGKQTEQALKVFEAMMQQDEVPDTITYSALISACAPGRALLVFHARE